MALALAQVTMLVVSIALGMYRRLYHRLAGPYHFSNALSEDTAAATLVPFSEMESG